MSRRAQLRTGAYAAALLAGLSAMVTLHWTAGGTWLLDTVGGAMEDLARRADAAAVAVGLAVVVLKLAGCALALALVRPWGRRLPAGALERTALAAGVLLTLYGGALVAVGALALAGVFGTVADPTALRWHVLFWDPWFLLWGAALVLAASARRRLRAETAARGPAPPPRRRSRRRPRKRDRASPPGAGRRGATGGR
ncbi:DUF3995 domain-containing protein [Blastococcus sp. SYSU DS0617]